ncbi:MAG: DUF1028 domain-containing protein [Anaerolineaceae bacterium]|nr:DUF1028 domain-containing protein [Anaerolineaceae bacterium]
MKSNKQQNRFPFAHTYSIVARDVVTGQMGVAVQSHYFSVGSIVGYGEAGVGVVASQSIADPSYGHLGLSLMKAGKTPEEALKALTSVDKNQDGRQVAMMDASGRIAAHTGERCIDFAGHELVEGEGFSVQANMMENASVWGAMGAAYRKADGDLADRMMAALQAAQDAGGDVRGKQSAAMLIVAGESTGRPWIGADIVLDLRVEDHAEPILELKRLISMYKAYDLMNKGDEALLSGQTDEAMRLYQTAADMIPDQIELPFWKAVTLADIGKLDEALPIFREIFSKNIEWAKLIERLPKSGLLNDDPELIKAILEECPES